MFALLLSSLHCSDLSVERDLTVDGFQEKECFMLSAAANLKVKLSLFGYTKLKTNNLAREKLMSDLW